MPFPCQKISARLAFLGLMWVAFAPLAGQLRAQGPERRLEYRVGAAAVDVTPAYPVRLNGFGGRREEAAGTSQHLWAKALAISHGSEPPVVIITLDNLGVRESLVDLVAAALQQRFQLPRQNLILTFTHTHSAPKVNGASDTIFSSPLPPEQQEHVDRYTEELPGLIIAAASEAIEVRQPASLAWGVGQVGFAVNRRTAGGPVDHDLPVLVARARDGRTLAVYTTYACHCVTLSFNQYSGDWAGYAQELIEREFPRAVGLVSIGCGSDANPSSGVTGDNVAAAAAQGAEIAAEVKRVMAGPLRELSGPLAVRLEHLDLPLNKLPTRGELEATVAAGGSAGYNASWQLAKLDRGEPLTSELRYPIQSLRFGEALQMVFLAGEVCVDYALRLKRELHRDRIWLHGYSNDFGAYIPSERLLQEGGYGGGGEIPYFALPTTLAPGLENKIIEAVKAQTPEEFLAPRGTQGIPPKTPEESLAAIKVHADLEVQLVAAEPLIADPVAIDFGPDGRLWVVEMPDYGRGVGEEFAGSGRVKFLSDRNRDGRCDEATLFLDGLRFPTEVKVWRDGVLVCDAPDILFAADRDGDGRAEVREVVWSGFATHNPHARVNSLRWGLDGYLYGSGGLFGGRLTREIASGTEVVEATNRDFRLAVNDLSASPATGQTQQGRARDDFDNWFGCNNSVLLQHYPLAYSLTERNSRLSPPELVHVVPSDAHGQQLYPAQGLVLFKLSGPPGRPTSACGLEIYRDRFLGDEFTGNAFTCEPVNQLVHRQVLSREGVTFRGERAIGEERSEFLTSTDNWFRPVQMRMGPEGALYLVDMYRYVIEHGQWIPDESKAELDIFAGQRLGRIYRIVPRGRKVEAGPDLTQAPTEKLLAELRSDNGVRRDLAAQVLFWRGQNSVAAVAAVREIAEDVQALPAVRVQAFATACLLGGGLKAEAELTTAVRLLTLPHQEAVRATLRLVDRWSDVEPLSDRLANEIVRLAQAEPLAVRVEALGLLGRIEQPAAVERLAHSLIHAGMGSAEQYAAMASLTSRNAPHVWAKALANWRLDSAESERMELLLSACVERGGEPIEEEIFGELVDGLRRCGEGSGPGKLAESAGWCRLAGAWLSEVSGPGEPRSERANQAAELVGLAFAAIPTAAELGEEISNEAWRNWLEFFRRVQGSELTGLLTAAQQQRLRDAVQAALEPSRSPTVQSGAVRLLAADRAGLQVAWERWNALTPALRHELVEAVLLRKELYGELLGAIESGLLRTSELDAGQRGRLLAEDDPAIRERAVGILQQVAHSDRSALVREWEAALQLNGDFERGRVVFRQHCAACHLLDGVGYEVGPDLAALTNRTPSAVLVAVLDPNRDLESRYLSYSALTREGLTLTGLLAEETATSVRLKEREGKEHVILRSELEQLQATRKSVMPEGLEQELQHQDLADLIAYIGPGRLPRRAFEGNQPLLARPDEDGVITCSASAAEVYGETIVYESNSPFRNLGFWSGERDHAVWSVELPKAGRYDLYLDYACNPDTAGNGFVVAGPSGELAGVVESTGAWTEYRWKKVGELQLQPGRQRLTIGFSGPRRGSALMDLRTVVLVPAGTVWPAKQ
ncbi:MAG: neutral/alkaline non-lysosomal ceramidase N-terminal domain-containing protein [Planctomycetota bacterium]